MSRYYVCSEREVHTCDSETCVHTCDSETCVHTCDSETCVHTCDLVSQCSLLLGMLL